MSSVTSSEKKGWKAIIIAFILSCFFLGFFYLAITNEPDYMPSQQNKPTTQHAFKQQPTMSKEALESAQQDAKMREEMKNMSPEEMQHMHGATATADKAN
ncbi:hypothetical protein [Acinetobacter stercoris]|uniref:DUF4199 domain-containing protein n=1 Tax=Acinetobacter stercoris TaxID=2126983 RepID=A0A2U3MW16_9GAMM|nr:MULTISPECIES: hypothetical protein [Acinetobacter]SPL69622.1 hypothetical protein KPC_0800 [Acinetobacter stercoris]